MMRQICLLTLIILGINKSAFAQQVDRDSLAIEYYDSLYYQNTFSLSDTIFEVGQIYRVEPSIRFPYNRYEIMEESFPVIDSIANFLKRYPSLVVEVGHHKDERGGDMYSRSPTQRRAQNIVNALIERGIDKERLIARGYGSDKTVVPIIGFEKSKNEVLEKVHQINRRTELKILVTDLYSNRGSQIEISTDTISRYCVSFPDLCTEIDVDRLIELMVDKNCMYDQFIGEGGVYTKEYASFERLRDVLSQEEMFQLIKHNNPVVRLYAYRGLRMSNSKYLDQAREILRKDTTTVCTFEGCIMSSFQLNFSID